MRIPREDDFVSTTAVRPRRRAMLGLMRGLYWSRLGSAYIRASGAGGAVILCYHSVPEPETWGYIDPYNRLRIERFTWQMAFLAARRHVISLDALIETMARGHTVPAGTVVLTFDDGYRDALTVVTPILKKFGFPATLYLPTGWIDASEVPWSDRVYLAFKTRQQHAYYDERVAPNPFVLRRRSGRRAAHRAIMSKMLRVDQSTREALVDEVERQLQPRETAPRLLLTWEEVRRLKSIYPSWTIGVHATHHVDLTCQSMSTVHDEIEACKIAYQRTFERPPRHFAYPYGHHDPTIRGCLRRAGFETATAGEPPMARIQPTTDPFAMPRMTAPNSMSLFRFWTSGAYPL